MFFSWRVNRLMHGEEEMTLDSSQSLPSSMRDIGNILITDFILYITHYADFLLLTLFKTCSPLMIIRSKGD